MIDLADHWNNPTNRLWRSSPYYHTSSSEGLDLLLAHGADYSVSILGVEEDARQTADLALMPLLAFPLLPAYTLPQGLQIVLDLHTIASIYLGAVTNWNDSSIRNLNAPHVRAMLPNADIRLVVDDVDSDINELITRLLSSKVPAFAAAVGVSRRPSFPAMARNTTVLSRFPGQAGQVLSLTPHSFALMDWVGLRHNALAISKDEYAGYRTQAAAIRLESNAVVLASSESVRSALDESVEAGASLAKASVLDVVRPGSWPMTAVATLIVRKQRLNCNESDLADFLRWIHSPTAEQRVSVANGFVLAHTNAKLAQLLFDLLAGFACQTPSLPLEHPDT
jgi:ABC-type phosphate transport system substrate-binding protein